MASKNQSISKYKKYFLKIKPNPSKNNWDPSKNKCQKGWILEFVF